MIFERPIPWSFEKQENSCVLTPDAVARRSVGRGTGLVIERLRNLGSTSDAVARRCLPLWGQAVYQLWWPSLMRHVNRAASVLEWYDRYRAYNIWFKRRRSCVLSIWKALTDSEF